MQLHLTMSSRAKAGQHVFVLTAILLTSFSRTAAAAQTRTRAGTANWRVSSGGLTSWWRRSQSHDPAERPPYWQAPHGWADSALTRSSGQGRQQSLSQRAGHLHKHALSGPAGLSVAAQAAKAASCAGGGATCTSRGSERSTRTSGQSAGDTAQLQLPPAARSVGGGLLLLRWWTSRRQPQDPISGGRGRRTLTAVVASELPRAALEDVLLTDDELAFTESGVEQSALSEASPLSLHCAHSWDSITSVPRAV